MLFQAAIPLLLRSYAWTAERLLLNPLLFAVLTGVFLLERRMPANRHQGLVSKGFWQDGFWFLGDGVLWMGALTLVGEAVRSGYDRHLSFLNIDVALRLPTFARIAFALLLIDFLDWARHYLKHRIWWLWIFHAVHHSQREMNLFTDFRVHVAERLINILLVFIPLRMFHVTTPTDYYIALVLGWYRVIYHANLRTNYGPLKYFLVTPQFHRVHHSVESAHVDTNFGVLFTVWDRLFGTHWTNYDDYPATGIDDSRFPFEQARGGAAVVGNWVAQTIYPFVELVRHARPRRGDASS